MLLSAQSTKGSSSATGRMIVSIRRRVTAWILWMASAGGTGGLVCLSRLPSSLVGQSARGPTFALSMVGLGLRVFDLSKSIIESRMRPSSAGANHVVHVPVIVCQPGIHSYHPVQIISVDNSIRITQPWRDGSDGVFDLHYACA
jgi:hypothetical protein